MAGNLPKTEYLGLTFDNIVVDIKNKIKENPNYNSNWNDFFSSNAGRMLVELWAYIVEQLGTRVDILVNEFFIDTAQQTSSLVNLLKLINYTPRLANCSQIDLLSQVDTLYQSNILMPFPLIITTNDLNGNAISFELIKKDINGKFVYPYDPDTSGETQEFSITNYNPKIDTLTFFEGSTKSISYTAQGIEGELINLSDSNIINNSVRIFFKTFDNLGNVIFKEGTQVSNFLDTEAQANSAFLPFIIELQPDLTLGIRFSNKTIMINKAEFTATTGDDLTNWEEKLPVEGDTYSIFYRVGGGLNTNIEANKISETRSFYDPNNATTITMSFSNPKAGYFGDDAETLEQARTNGPNQYATLNRTVTISDHQAIINNISTVLKSISYGQENKPNVVPDYGFDINSLETWHYIVPNVSGWQSKKTFDYPDIFRFTSREMEYLNQKLSYSTGGVNIALTFRAGDEEDDTSSADSKYRKWVVLSETDSKKFIQSSSGTNQIYKIGNNNVFLSNFEGNEDNFEQLNIKITNGKAIKYQTSTTDENKWQNIISEFSYNGTLYTTGIFNDSDCNTFTIEIVNDKFIKLTFQGRKLISEIGDINANNVYLHYIKPNSTSYFTKDATNKEYEYLYIKNYPVFPNTFSTPYQLKFTKNKTLLRSSEAIIPDYIEKNDYNVVESISQKYYKIETNNYLSNFSSYSSPSDLSIGAFPANIVVAAPSADNDLFAVWDPVIINPGHGNLAARTVGFSTSDNSYVFMKQIALDSSIAIDSNSLTGLSNRIYRFSCSSSINTPQNTAQITISGPTTYAQLISLINAALPTGMIAEFFTPNPAGATNYINIGSILPESSFKIKFNGIGWGNNSLINNSDSVITLKNLSFSTSLSNAVSQLNLDIVNSTLDPYIEAFSYIDSNFINHIGISGLPQFVGQSCSFKITDDINTPITFNRSGSVYYFIQDGNFIGTSVKSKSNISDFDYFYANYKLDNRGYDLNIFSKINLNPISLLNNDNYSINVSASIGDETQTYDIQNMKFYKVISFGNAAIGDVSTSLGIMTLTQPSFSFTDISKLYIRTVSSVNDVHHKAISKILTHAPLSNTITFQEIIGFPDTLGDSGYFEIIQILSETEIRDYLNNYIHSSGQSFIKNYVFSIYDNNERIIIFSTRNISLMDDKVVSFKVDNFSSGESILNEFGILPGTSITSDEDGNLITDKYQNTNEYLINQSTQLKRMTCVDNIYQQPIFKTFDLWVNVYYNRSINKDNISQNIETALRNRYNLTNMNFGDSVHKSEISKIIHSVQGVLSASVVYFGSDYTKRIPEDPKINSNASQDNSIITKYDEITLIGDNEYQQDFPQLKQFQIHGIHIDMIVG